MNKSIIIIGGGLTGLATGCYGRMNGYQTSIYEMHNIAGGVATAWKRQGYTIDGAMNWLVGTRAGTGFNKFWEELGAAPGWKVYNHDRYSVTENEKGETFTVYCDADSFEEYLVGLAPEDKDVIHELAQGIRDFAKMDMVREKPAELMNMWDGVKAITMLPMLRLMKKWSKVSAGDFFKRFQNPYLRRMLALAFGVEGFPMMMIFWILGFQHRQAAGYVVGGALDLVHRLEKRYRDLGGQITLKARVAKILVENDRAVGIKMADGTEHRADWVVSAADGRTTIFDMLEGKYVDDAIRERYANPRLFTPLVHIGLGVASPCQEVPYCIGGYTFPLEKPIAIAGKEHDRLGVLNFGYDPTLAPQGKAVLKVQFETDYDYWDRLYKEPERYKAEKERIADEVIAALDKRFPGLAKKIEMRDVATPVTWVRYTGNWRGSYEGWMFSSESFMSSMKKTLPGLDNFYMAGQWVNPGGGMPTAAMSGRNTMQLICHRDGLKFAAAKP